METIFLPEEQIIARSSSDQVVLTNLRLRYSDDGREVKSIMLDQISGIHMLKDHKPWLLVLTAVSLICAGFFLTELNSETAIIPTIAALFFTLLYFATRRHIVTVASSAMSIVFQTKGMASIEVLQFLNQVEEGRINYLKNKTLA